MLRLPNPPPEYIQPWANQYTQVLELENQQIWNALQGITTKVVIAPGGSLKTVGAYAITLTATAATGITLPTTGTLATLTGSEVLTNKTLTAPVLTTPTLGVASATTINRVTLTTPATGSTLTIADGKTLTVSNILTLAGTDSTVMTFPATSGTVVTLAASQVLTNKTLTAPVISSISNTGTVTFPTSTDTLVGKATTDVLTNKTLTQPALTAFTVGTLGTATAGLMAYVTDGDPALAWGATVVNSGAGATKYLVWANGANWTVVGK